MSFTASIFKSLHTVYKGHLGKMEKHRISFILLIIILPFNTQQVHSVKFTSKFRHMTNISEIMLLPELQLTALKEVPVSGLTECSMRCMSWECILFGVKGKNSNTCLLWTPSSNGSQVQSFESNLTSSGLYLRYKPGKYTSIDL